MQILLVFVVFACIDPVLNPKVIEGPEFDYLTTTDAELSEENGVVYGSNNAYNLVDIIEAPKNEDNARPLILLSPGGGFKYFNRLNDIKSLARDLASRGYVVGIVKYRIDNNLDHSNAVAMQRIWLDGMIDQKTAIRYFKTNAAAYRIDPDKIFIGGWSNGGQLAISTATFQEDELVTMNNEAIKTSVASIVEAIGGMEGNDHLTVDSDVRGALLLNIYSFDLNSIDSDDPAIMFIHHKESRISSLPHVLTVGEFTLGNDTFYGPRPITEKATTVGYTMGADVDYIEMSGQSYIETIPGLNYHEPNFASLSKVNYDKIADFFHRNLQ